MDATLIQLISEQTGLAAFAALALFFLWLTMREALKREKENARMHREDKMLIREVLDGVTRSNTRLCDLIAELRDDLRNNRL